MGSRNQKGHRAASGRFFWRGGVVWFLEIHAGETDVLKCGLNHKPLLLCWLLEGFAFVAFQQELVASSQC